MDDAQEIQTMRARMHELSEKLNAATVRVEVTATKLESKADQLDRIEDSLRDLASEKRAQNGRLDKTETRLTVIETRGDEARNAGSKWGAGMGSLAGFLGGMIGGMLKGMGAHPQ